MSTIKSSDEHLTLNADGSSKDIKLQSNASEKVIVKSTGNVGIGTSSPDSLLEIYKAGTSELMIGSDNGGTAQISLYENDSTTKEATIKYDGSANNLVIGTSGEANAIVIPRDSGNVGIGVTPESWHSSYKALQIGNTGTLFKDNANGGDFSIGNNFYLNSTPAYAYTTTAEASRHSQENGIHYFQVAPSGSADAAISWTTAMTIHQAQSGAAADISMGERWSGDGGGKTDFQTNTNGGILMRMSSVNTGGNQRVWFVNPNGLVGNITTSGSGTSFNTSSDYRLKENVNYDWDATTRLKQLKPARFNFIADSDTIVDGFLAHEAAEVVPEAVSGVKDAMMDKDVYDKDGNVTGTESVINPQSIDQAKLVPLLVKTIQELEARITALEA